MYNLGQIKLAALFFFCSQFAFAGKDKKFIVITDIEPDDLVAIQLLAANVAERIAFFGATILHSERKKVLLERFRDQLNLSHIPVYQGMGGRGEGYPDIASTKAARTYKGEGKGLIPDRDLRSLNAVQNRSSPYLAKKIVQYLLSHEGTEILLLAPPTDLVSAIAMEPKIKAKISHIHIMGGWDQVKNGAGNLENRTTYNWNMAPKESSHLMQMQGVAMTVYSSHLIKPSFSGGSINKKNFPKIARLIEALVTQVPSMRSFNIAAKSWDNHVMEQIPVLKSVIGPYAGMQFTPADPATVIGVISQGFVKKMRRVRIRIDLKNLAHNRGYKVNISEDIKSEIRVVEAIDISIFRNEMVKSLNWLGKKFCSNCQL